jgi:hypothetical protein
MKKIIPLIRDGKTEEASRELQEDLKERTRTHLLEQKKRVAAALFEDATVPNTKGSVDELHSTLLSNGFKKTREAKGAKNPLGNTILHDYKQPMGEHFRVHHLAKTEGGEHVGWAHMKQKLGETFPRPVKTGTGQKSLSTYLKKINAVTEQATLAEAEFDARSHLVKHGFSKTSSANGTAIYNHPAGHKVVFNVDAAQKPTGYKIQNAGGSYEKGTTPADFQSHFKKLIAK